MTRDRAGDRARDRAQDQKAFPAVWSACAAAAAASLGAASDTARGGLMVDLNALPGPGYTLASGGKSVVAPAGVTVTVGVYARLSGANSFQQIGDLDGDADAPDTRNDDSLDLLVGSFRSIGGLLGNMNSAAGAVNYNTRVVPFAAQATQNGVAGDYDSDGDLDIGVPGGSDISTMWAIRSGAQTFATRFDGTTNGWTNGNGLQNPSLLGLNDEDAVVDATTSVLRVGTLRFAIVGGSGSAALNFVPRAGTDFTTALWWEDGVATGMQPGTGSFTIGAPVIVAPEPASAAVLGLGSVGLLAARRKRTS